jgi:group I intron endonuclease
MGYIYILTSPNGKSYIGQTIRPIEKRFEAHQRDSKCRVIYNAIQYHGWENFEKDYYECPDNDLNFDEELLIREMGTLSPGGYNLREGGGSHGKLNKETKQKISEILRGEKNPMYGKTHSEKTKQKMRKPKSEEAIQNMRIPKGKDHKKKIGEAQLGEKHHSSKRVYQYDLEGNYIGSFGSGREAARHLNKKSGPKISACARGDSKTAYGFKWSHISPVV